MSSNFCSWADANRFMRECAAFTDDSRDEQRANLELAHALESPLKAVMLAALKAAVKTAQISDPGKILTELGLALSVKVETAQPIGRYRADLIVAGATIPDEMQLHIPRVVVECDGFTFHDRTREQARHDRERDRYMLGRGLVVMRFTGDEITEAPFACAAEVLTIAHGRFLQFDRDDPKQGAWPVFRRGHGAREEAGPMSLREFDHARGVFGAEWARDSAQPKEAA